MADLNLFKIEYSWYEGEYRCHILATEKSKEEIEKDLKEVVKNIKIDEDEVNCLPNAYGEVINALRKNGYSLCWFIDNPLFKVEDRTSKSIPKYSIKHKEEKVKWVNLNQE